MPNRLSVLMPVFARHEGRWGGIYTHQTPEGALIDRYEVRTLAEFPSDGSCDFRLNTHNIWPDGRESRFSFDANFRDNRVWFDCALIGSIWEIDDVTTYLRFGYRNDPSIDVCEMIQISHDGQHRARTWHWFRDQQLYKITLTDEARIA